ncbi:hypothetical protein [Nocardioides sp. KR10-350]|uniref:hypothetical protein n=1 Tax=Nocardioides cheoyonin TaxID=3156615 RepID=UPI0032B42974
MTWTTYHNRAEILRTVMAVADERRDGLLPMDVEGVVEKFDDELGLLGTLQLKWHTRLAGRIEQELNDQPMDLESAVVRAWQQTAAEMPGVRAILDHYRSEPVDARMAETMAKAHAKEHLLLAVMAGKGAYSDELAVPAGAAIEERARASYRPLGPVPAQRGTSLLGRIKAALAA